MKKFLSLSFAITAFFATASPAWTCPPVNDIAEVNKPEIKTDIPSTSTTEYNPLWVIDDEAKHKIRKFIWIPSEDGKSLLVIEASDEAILRLAWNLDTYKHGATTETN